MSYPSTPIRIDRGLTIAWGKAIRTHKDIGIPRWLADGDDVFLRWRGTDKGVRCKVVCAAGNHARIEAINPAHSEVNGWQALEDLRVKMEPVPDAE